MLLSIIIPVYQVEQYLEQCLNSVLSCDLEDCEILLSLGNSTDCSNQMCQKFAEKHPLIHPLMQEGTGLSDARNSAMKIARGDYLLFLDSDDFVLPENLNVLISHLRDSIFLADVIVTDFYRISRSSGRVEEIFQIGRDTPTQRGIDFLPKMLQKRQCFWNVWRYIYRREFLEEHNIHFCENTLSEDVDFTTSIFLAYPNVIFCHNPYYVYCVEREDSLMGNPTLKRLSDTTTVLQNSISRMKARGFPYAKNFIAQFQFEYILNLAFAVELPQRDRSAAQLLFQGWREVLADSPDILVRVTLGVIGAIGLIKTAHILHWLKMIRRWRRNHIIRRKTAE